MKKTARGDGVYINESMQSLIANDLILPRLTHVIFSCSSEIRLLLLLLLLYRCSMLGYCMSVCLFVSPSVTESRKCIVAKPYILQQKCLNK